MEIKNKKIYKLRELDMFDFESCTFGEYVSEEEVRNAARKRLEELEISQPTAESGGQNGIQDRIYVVRPDGTEYRYEIIKDSGEVLERHIKKCGKCGKYAGYVIEKYNGCVPVWCRCQYGDTENYDRKLNNPCMLAMEEKWLIWRRESVYKTKDGLEQMYPQYGGHEFVWHSKR